MPLRQVHLRSSQQQPLLLVVENLHWIDPTSEAYLASLVEQLAGAPLLLLTTYRPGTARSGWTNRMPRSSPCHHSPRRRARPWCAPCCRQSLGRAPGAAGAGPGGGESVVSGRVGAGRVGAGRPRHRHPVPETIQAVLAARIDRLRRPNTCCTRRRCLARRYPCRC